jgi:hypothetical protein
MILEAPRSTSSNSNQTWASAEPIPLLLFGMTRSAGNAVNPLKSNDLAGFLITI